MRKICTCEDSAGWTECGQCGGALWISKVSERSEEMNPPIIFVDFTDCENDSHLGSAYWSATKFRDDDVEYHLAPQWHDAVKDPPKEEDL